MSKVEIIEGVGNGVPRLLLVLVAARAAGTMWTPVDALAEHARMKRV